MSDKATKKGAVVSTVKTQSWARPTHPTPLLCVNSVGISDDGTRVASGTFFFNKTATTVKKEVGVYVYDQSGIQKLADKFFVTAAPKPHPPARGDKAGVHCVAITGDGVWAASGGELMPPPTAMGFIKAYHVTSATTWTLDSPPEQTSGVALSDDGTYLVAGADMLYLYTRSGDASAATWSMAQTLSFPGRTIKSVAISADGEWIVAGISGGEVALVKNISGNFGTYTLFPMPNIPGSSPVQRYWVMGVAIAKDGSGFAVAGSDATLYYFDVTAFPTSTAPAWTQALAGCASCRSVAMSEDGSLIAVSASAGTIGAPTGKGKVFLFQNSGGSGTALWATPATTGTSPNQVSIDATGQYVSVCDGSPPPGATNGDFYLFDGPTGAFVWSCATPEMNFSMQLSGDGTAAAGGSDDGKTYYFPVP